MDQRELFFRSTASVSCLAGQVGDHELFKPLEHAIQFFVTVSFNTVALAYLNS